ncbi:MAG TPA: hypothetical protein VFI31_06540 [Pirellulales bacterium]|nr:hypothetical protein [Pirellulales bacterium]
MNYAASGSDLHSAPFSVWLATALKACCWRKTDDGCGLWELAMKRLAKIGCTLVGLIAVGLAIDYVNVARKERLLLNAVSECDGRLGSIPVWPLGTEYRITLTSVPSKSQLRALAIANEMRGWVGIAFNNCVISQEDSERLLVALPNCHLFVVKEDGTIPMVDAIHQ